ncbi:hypothetical protein OSB04_019971 [Centaurea solstitialis]|uniref:Uncharacterized protein n=1 Tax=Centaurea solstitialis TaxID=347529 RepID=A0AA38SYY2_9ASTR|nr:hypothetical protein OSB04_019971 [Centaurea solstitialis]
MEASSRSEFDMGKQRSNACQISGVIQEMKIPRTESSKGGGFGLRDRASFVFLISLRSRYVLKGQRKGSRVRLR